MACLASLWHTQHISIPLPVAKNHCSSGPSTFRSKSSRTHWLRASKPVSENSVSGGVSEGHPDLQVISHPSTHQHPHSGRMVIEGTRESPVAVRTLHPFSHHSPSTPPVSTLHFVVVQSLTHIQLSATPWTAAGQAPLSSIIFWTLLKSMSTSLVTLSNHPTLCRPFLLLPLSFPMSQLFTSSGQSIGASASATILPMSIQGLFPLGLMGLISLQSKGLSRIFSSTTIQKYRFLVLSLLYGPTLTSEYDYWKNHSFNCRDLCWQSDVSAF